MTIALGILTPTSVVIAADTQEGGGYSGAGKISGFKIISRVLRNHERAISATGAGSAGYLDSLNQELIDAFIQEPAPLAAEAKIRMRLREFYDAHILPLQTLPDVDRPRADVIVGMTWKGKPPVLLASEHSTMRRIVDQEFVAAGSGQEHARMLLSRILPRGAVTTELAAFLAAYTVFHVKEHIEGCGKGTHVTVLEHGNAHYLSDEHISILEYRFGHYLRFDAVAVSYILGRPVPDEKQAAITLMNALGSIRKDAQDLTQMTIESPPFDLDWTRDVPPIGEGLQQIKAYADPPTPSPSRRRKRKAAKR